MVGHRAMGHSLLLTGHIIEGRAHYDQAIALYDPAQHRAVASRFGQDLRVATTCFRSWACWLLGYPEAALADAARALADARQTGQAATLMMALNVTSFIHTHCGNFATANAQADEVITLADEKGATLWKAWGMINQGCVSALAGKASDAVRMATAGHTAWRSTGAIVHGPLFFSLMWKPIRGIRAHSDDGKFRAARHLKHVKITVAVTRIERLHGHRNQKITLPVLANALALGRMADAVELVQGV